MGNQGDARRTLAAGAEMLAAYQLDLLAQIEAQLRAVRQTMQRIEAFRGSKANGTADAHRGLLLSGLSDEIEAIDSQLTLEHTSCREMLETVRVMQDTLAGIRLAAAIIQAGSDAAAP